MKKFIPNDDKLKKGDRKNDITNRYWSNERNIPKRIRTTRKRKKKIGIELRIEKEMEKGKLEEKIKTAENMKK